MMKIVQQGLLDRWTDANLKWLRDTFGEDNVVSCVLHMDEKTPHLHATVVPIVTGERKRKSREGEKKYRTQTGPRLSADDVMGRDRLSTYQNTYAEAMREFGLHHGVVGSTAKPIPSVIGCRRVRNSSKSISRITTTRRCISGHGSTKSGSMMSSSRSTTTSRNNTSTMK